MVMRSRYQTSFTKLLIKLGTVNNFLSSDVLAITIWNIYFVAKSILQFGILEREERLFTALKILIEFS